ncbi:hypothetical protein X947_5781 [Burkholderia pseudomallei MSHR7334]|nr:hypothetical protein X947_5781 [Burkholderia pseudomallei MSHR7334]
MKSAFSISRKRSPFLIFWVPKILTFEDFGAPSVMLSG